MTADDERIAIADAYLRALLTHDGASVQFHPKAVRYEAGIKTGFSGRHLTRSLTHGPQFRLVAGLREHEWSVEGDNVIVDYLLDAQVFGRRLKPLRIHEVFVIPVEDPRIRRIDVRFSRRR